MHTRSIVAPGGCKNMSNKISYEQNSMYTVSTILGSCYSQNHGKPTPLGAANDAVNRDTIAGTYFDEKYATMLNLMVDFSDTMIVVSLVFCEEIVNCIGDTALNDQLQKRKGKNNFGRRTTR